MKLVTLLLLIFYSLGARGQNFYSISIDTLPIRNNNIKVDNLRFYISGIKLLNQGTTAFEEPNSFHFIDLFKENQLTFSIPDTLKYNEVIFQLGIDSITNTSGALGGDLDPTKGMY